MDLQNDPDFDALLGDDGDDSDLAPVASAPDVGAPLARRDPLQLLSRIPVKLTLEVGSATVSLAELTAIEQGSVIELDRLAGEPLLIKVNDTVVGRAEVVVSGESYGLKVLDIEPLGGMTS